MLKIEKRERERKREREKERERSVLRAAANVSLPNTSMEPASTALGSLRVVSI